jgi:single-strand DNA-binding protein
MTVNKVILVGRLGRDPEVKETQGGKKYARFSIATSEKNKAGDVLTEWHNITAFGNVVDVIEKYVTKGTMLYVEGKIQSSEYEKDGIKRKDFGIILNSMTMLGGGEKKADPSARGGQQAQQADDLDDDIPF